MERQVKAPRSKKLTRKVLEQMKVELRRMTTPTKTKWC
jgi:hypothetical protein